MKWRVFSLAILTAVLTACGGGGGEPSAKPQSQVLANSATIKGVAMGPDGKPLQGVDVSMGTTHAATNAKGEYQLDVANSTATRTVVQFSLKGYATQFGVSELPPITGANIRVAATLQKVTAALTFDPLANAALTVPQLGPIAAVNIAANGLVRADGSAPKGAVVNAQITVIDPKANLSFMPGNYLAQGAAGTEAIESFGALQVTLTDTDGGTLSLKSGQTAVIRIPASQATTATVLPADVPLYYFDEKSGLWKAEGSAKLAKDSAGNAYYEGQVAHFSYWNADRPLDTTLVSGCVQDSAGAPVSGLTVIGVGRDYLGSSVTFTDASGKFAIPVKTKGLSFIGAMSYAPAATSNQVTAIAQASSETMPSCLRIDLVSAALATYAGVYKGTYTGLDRGVFSVAINSAGVILGSGESTAGAGSFGVQGQVSSTGSVALNAAQGSAGIATFAGNINAETGALSGAWQYVPSTGLSGGGTYQGQRQ